MNGTIFLSQPNELNHAEQKGKCCSHLNFQSDGTLAESVQKFLLGVYDYWGEGEDGTMIYKHPETLSYPAHYLYLLASQPPAPVWYINFEVGNNWGPIRNMDWLNHCPEDLDHIWQWSDNNGKMIMDDKAYMECS